MTDTLCTKVSVTFDYIGNPVEILYNELDDGKIKVFSPYLAGVLIFP
jgi:hypothetical protein